MANLSYSDTPVSQAIEALGGPNKAAAKLCMTRQAIHLWRKTGYVTRRDMAIRLARLSGIPVEGLLGLPIKAAAVAVKRNVA